MKDNNFNCPKEQEDKLNSHYTKPHSIRNKTEIVQIDGNITEKLKLTNQNMKENNFNSLKECEKINCHKFGKRRCIKNKTGITEITEIDDDIKGKPEITNQNTENNNFNSPKENKTTNDVKKYKRKIRNISNFSCKREFKKKLPLILLILLFLGIISSMIYLIIKLFTKNNNKIGENYPEEVLITNINYTENLIYKFHSKKIINLKGESRDKLDDKNSTQNLVQYMDFFFLIRNKSNELEIKKNYIKNIYIGYIGILNITINNGTNDMMIIYDESLDKIIKENKNKNLRMLENNQDIDYAQYSNKSCFIKIEFYENGNIKKIFIPDYLDISNMIYINNIIKLIIPKLSPNLYSNNIEKQINELNIFGEVNNTYDEDEENYTDLIYMKEAIQNENENENENNEDESDDKLENEDEDFDDDPDNDAVEDDDTYSSPTERKSYNIGLRGIKSDKNNNTNLSEYSINNLENNNMKFENSILNTNIIRNIDKDGYLKSIEEIQIMKMYQYDDIENNDEEQNSQGNNKDNLISNEDLPNGEDDINKFKFNISEISIESTNNIFLSDNFNNTELNKKIYNYFDTFKYKMYNETEYQEEISKEDVNITENDVRLLSKKDLYLLNKKKSRNLDISNSYYGLTYIIYEKDIYNLNLLGLKLGGNILVETDFSTGIVSSYFVMTIGGLKKKFIFKEQHTNMHIITQQTNQMTWKYMILLDKTNKDLIERNKEYSDIIINYENEVIDMFQNPFDFSFIFRDSLKDMYQQVQNFTGEFFTELIELINRVHKNYTIILKNIKLNKNELINEILIVTKNEYIKYIYDMVDILAKFENDTIRFLDNVEKEVYNINIFQIDVLYDIIDSIYDCKIIFKKFNKNLFNAIEKGILTFKYDIKDYIDEIIGDLLYLTDFLAVNINKNEILKKQLDETIRKNITIKLKDFRDIIINIMDIIIDRINLDYDNEMSIDNQNSVKYYSEEKSIELLKEIDDKSNDVIKHIKNKIKYINLYEKYCENLDTINNINNKTILEFNDKIYKNILVKFSEIQPDYLNDSSNIISNKNKLFRISENLVNLINEEIKEINNHILSYSKNYIESNLYYIHYNLYHFRKYFLDNEMISLLKEYKTIINKTILVHYKSIIDYNYNLALEYVNDEIGYGNAYSGKRYVCSGFVTRYYNYISNFQEFLYLMCSEEFLDLLYFYYFKIRDDILNYIDKKVLSIKKYYFNNELYKNNFYFIDQINNEIYKIISNIHNYFNEIIINEINVKSANLSLEILKPYNEQKEKYLEKKYNQAVHSTRGVYDCGSDFIYITRRKAKNFWRTKKYRYKMPHIKNINKIIKDLKKTNNYLNDSVNILISNFINKFDSYLKNYITLAQTLYSNLYSYYEEKSNNHNYIKNILNDYQKILNETIINDSHEQLFEKFNNLKENDYKDSIENALLDFKNNIDEIENIYFKEFYLNDNKDFLEYPEEIKYKIKQFLYELKNNSNFIKDKINLSFKSKVLSIINSTNIFIGNNIKFNLEYIITHINNHNINKNYFDSKTGVLKDIFYNYIRELNKISDNFYDKQNSKDLLILDENNYGIKINNIFENITNFYLDFENIIENNFTYEKCFNKTVEENGENNTIMECTIERYKSDLDYSIYNFNIVKLRTGLYYTKNLIEFTDNIIDGINYNNLISKEQINKNDQVLNNKNILYIYNETLFKINEINKESDLIIDEVFEEFLVDFKNQYTFGNDFLPFYFDLMTILKFKNNDYINNITYIYNNTLVNISDFIASFNNTLYDQISLRKKYDYYNLKENNFNKVFSDYNSIITNFFNAYKTKIMNLDKNYIFYNSLKLILRKLQNNKRIYYQNNINEIIKNYDYELLNKTYDLGQKVFDYLLKDYEDYEFKFIYDYFELYENNTNIYIQGLLKIINNLENIIKNNLNDVYYQFIDNYKMNISKFVNYDYIHELEINFTNCIDYSYDKLNEIKNEDENNFKKYLDYLELIKLNQNCSNKTNNDLYISNETDILTENNTCLNISDIKPFEFYNKTEHLLNCYENQYYNYSVFIFENFNKTYKNELDNIINNIQDEIKLNYFDEKFLNDYLEKYYHFNSDYNISHDELYFHYEDFEDLIFYVNYLKNEEYKNLLYNSLIHSFKKSYDQFINEYIINEINKNISIYINDKFDIFIERLKSKLQYEFNYYLFLFNNTKEIGSSTKNAFINLYSDFKNNIKDDLNYLIEEEIYFYINIFERQNKKQFMNNFINYYFEDNQRYKIDIFKLKYYFEDIILDKKFNKTIISISNILMDRLIESAINKINEIKNNKLISLYNTFDIINKEITKRLENISINSIPDGMNDLIDLINNYTILLKQQNMRFKFIFSDKTFDLLNNLTENELRPPLLLIKQSYNSIEDALINKIMEIVNNFPNFYSLIKEKLSIESKLENITIVYSEINSSLYEYREILNKEIDQYFIKLVTYSFINGFNIYEGECKHEFCKKFDPENNDTKNKIDNFDDNKVNDTNNNSGQTNNENENKANNYDLLSFNEIKKKINNYVDINKPEEFDSTKGSLGRYDVLFYLYKIHNTLLNFNDTLLNKEYKSINRTVNGYINKINTTYLGLLKRSFSITLMKFLTIITEDNFERLEQEIYKQYYKIESYINQKSYQIRSDIDNFLYKLNSTSNFIEVIDYLNYFRIESYYDIISSSIQKKLIVPNKKSTRKVSNIINYKRNTRKESDIISYEEDRYDFGFSSGETFNAYLNVQKFFNKSKNHMGYVSKFNISVSLNYSSNFSLYWSKNWTIPIPIDFRLYPNIKAILIFESTAGIGINLIPFDFREKKFCLHLNPYAKAEAYTNFEIGVYYPGKNGAFEMSLSIGIKGILGSGEVGLDLKLYFNSELKIDWYYKYFALQLSFYMVFRITIELKYIKSLRFDIYIINQILFGLYKEKHNIKVKEL